MIQGFGFTFSLYFKNTYYALSQHAGQSGLSGPGPQELRDRDCFPLPPDNHSDPSSELFARSEDPNSLEDIAQEFGGDSTEYHGVYRVGVSEDDSQLCFVEDHAFRSMHLQDFHQATWRRALQSTHNFTYASPNTPQTPIRPWGLYRHRRCSGGSDESGVYVYQRHPILLNLCSPDFPASSAFHPVPGFDRMPQSDVIDFANHIGLRPRGSSLNRWTSRLLSRPQATARVTNSTNYCLTLPDPHTGLRTMAFPGAQGESITRLLSLLEYIEDPNGFSTSGAYDFSFLIPGFTHFDVHAGIDDPRAYEYAEGLHDFLGPQIVTRDMMTISGAMTMLGIIAGSLFARQQMQSMFDVNSAFTDDTGMLHAMADPLIDVTNNPYHQRVVDLTRAAFANSRYPHQLFSGASGALKGFCLQSVGALAVSGNLGIQANRWDRFVANTIRPIYNFWEGASQRYFFIPNPKKLIFLPDLYLGTRYIRMAANAITRVGGPMQNAVSTIFSKIIESSANRSGFTIIHLEEAQQFVAVGDGNHPVNLLSQLLMVANRANRGYNRIIFILDTSQPHVIFNHPGSRDLRRRVQIVEYIPPMREDIAVLVRQVVILNRASSDPRIRSDYNRALVNADVYEALSWLAEGRQGASSAPPGTALDMLNEIISSRVSGESTRTRGRQANGHVIISREHVLDYYFSQHSDLVAPHADGSDVTSEETRAAVENVIRERQTHPGAYQELLNRAFYTNNKEPFVPILNNGNPVDPRQIVQALTTRRWNPEVPMAITQERIRQLLVERYTAYDMTPPVDWWRYDLRIPHWLQEGRQNVQRRVRAVHGWVRKRSQTDPVLDQIDALAARIMAEYTGPRQGPGGLPQEDTLRGLIDRSLQHLASDTSVRSSAQRWTQLESHYRHQRDLETQHIREEATRLITSYRERLSKRGIRLLVEDRVIGRAFEPDISDLDPYNALNLLEDVISQKTLRHIQGNDVSITEQDIVEYHARTLVSTGSSAYRTPPPPQLSTLHLHLPSLMPDPRLLSIPHET